MEFAWLRKIDFFPPPPPTDFPEAICIATKSRNLGDALALTTLPEKIKSLHPKTKIFTYPRGFNPVVFKNNPFVSGVKFLPGEVYGDDINFGSGHLIQLKERGLSLPISDDPKPSLFLSNTEKQWASSFFSDVKNPICFLHPRGVTQHNVLREFNWDKLIGRLESRLHFVQIGVEGDTKIPKIRQVFFARKNKKEDARRLFALLCQGKAFVGVDSGPMHVARAFGLPSIVLTRNTPLARLFEDRKNFPYYARKNWLFATLYEANTHIDAENIDIDLIGDKLTALL